MSPKHVCLIILDGWGYREGKDHNAIAEANTPFFDELMAKYPHTLLNASEEHVGLPKGTIGNSEIGHMTIGAGKTIDTDLVKISKAFLTSQIKNNPAFCGLFEHVKKFNSTLHILGLLSPGGVHSHEDHLHDFLKATKQAGMEKIVIHAFTDGRDVPPQSAAESLKVLEDLIADLGIGRIATASGRYFAMDRDNNWERTEKVEQAIFESKGKTYSAIKPSEALKTLYEQGVLDEHLEPLIFLDDQGKSYPVADNDGVFFFNFRSDRPRQLSKKIAERAERQNLFFLTMTEYDSTIESRVAFPAQKIKATLAGEIARAGLTQSHIAETEKYAHVTYFFNGGQEEPYQNERHFLIESRRDIATHDQAPEMRAREIADTALERIAAGDNFLVINFANADMVGHTANKPAIIVAVETVDKELKRVAEAVIAKGGIVIVTADHGNAEVNIDPLSGENHTAHTLNLVPFILVVPLPATSYQLQATSRHSLADIAPTILELLQIKKPASMTGKSLLQK